MELVHGLFSNTYCSLNSYHSHHYHYFRYFQQSLFQLQSPSQRSLKLILVFWLFLFRTLIGIMAFPFIEKAFKIKEVFFFLLVNNIDIYCREILASTLFLSIIAARTALVVWISFVGLVDRRLLFSTKYVSRGGVSRLIFPGVLILLLC